MSISTSDDIVKVVIVLKRLRKKTPENRCVRFGSHTVTGNKPPLRMSRGGRKLQHSTWLFRSRHSSFMSIDDHREPHLTTPFAAS